MQINFTPFPQQRQKKENRPKAKERKASRTTFIDITGKRFGRWLVLGESPKPRKGQTRWHCRCDCGKEKSAVQYGGLVRGASKSCGCLRMEGLNHVFHKSRSLETAVAILRAQGHVFYERSSEKGSIRRNKTDATRVRKKSAT